MAGAGRKQERLVQLARRAGFNQANPRLTLQGPLNINPTPQETEAALTTLTENRATRLAESDRCISCKSSSAPFKPHEKNAAIQTVVEHGGSAGQVAALLAMNANVNVARPKSTGLIKRLRGRDQKERRSNVFDASIQRDKLDIFRVLAATADQRNIDAALGGILSRKNDGQLPYLEVLLSCKANPNLYASEIQSLVKDGRSPFAHRLCSGVIPLSPFVATENLNDAVADGNLTTVALLLSHSADADSNAAMTLTQAISLRRLDIVSALCLASKPPGSANLANAVATVAAEPALSEDIRLHLLEILLTAGASGLAVEKALAHVTKAENQAAVSLLVEYAGGDTSYATENIKTAMSRSNMSLFRTFMDSSVNKVTTDAALAHVWKIRPDVPYELWFQMMKDIVSKGVTPNALGSSLLHASKHYEMAAVEYFVDAGASADYKDGRALVLAVSDLRLDLVKALLRTQPLNPNLVSAFLKLARPRRSHALLIASALLDAGARGAEIDEVLRISMGDSDPDDNLYSFLSMLVRAGADVNAGGGECFTNAASRADFTELRILLKGRHSAASTACGVAAALGITDAEKRYQIMELLLSNGASGQDVDRTLAAVIRTSDDSLRFVELLLQQGRPDVNYNHGEPVISAIRHHNVPVLTALLQHDPTDNTLSRGMTEAMHFGDQSLRLHICTMLLQAGATGSSVDQALVDAVKPNPPDRKLIALLLAHNASIDFSEARALRLCVKATDVQLLGVLLTKPASKSTLAAALVVAVLIRSQDERLQCIELILGKGGRELVRELNRHLPATFETSEDLRVLDCFLQNGASVDHEAASALVKAATIGNIPALELLLAHSPSATSLRTVFEAAWITQGGTRLPALQAILITQGQDSTIDVSSWLVKALEENTISADLVALLLAHRASVHHADNTPLKRALQRSNTRILKQLLQSTSSIEAVSSVFGNSISIDTPWLSTKNVECLNILLDHGACGEPIDKALLQCVSNPRACPSGFIERLVQYGASVEYQDGAALTLATRSASVALIEKLLPSHPPRHILEAIFPNILRSGSSEGNVMAMMTLFLQEDPDLDLHVQQRGFNPILFESLQLWPESVLILEKLMDNGAHPDQCMALKSPDGQSEQSVNMLMWAICKPDGPPISDELIEALLKRDPDVNFFSEVFGTPLTASIRKSRAEVAALLIQSGAEVSLRDSHDRSALFYASSTGTLDTMRMLIDSGAPRNDGSVHEAARRCKHSAVRLLLDADHNPNEPSRLHGERGPLAELTTQLKESRMDSEVISHTMSILVAGGAEQRLQVGGKSLLLLAIDSPRAVEKTKAMLKAFMGPLVNDEFNQYKHSGLIYSPLSYLQKDLQKSHASQKVPLIHVLETYGCKSVFYRLKGDQPHDYVGAPPAIQMQEERRQERQRRIQQEHEDQERRLALAAERERDETQRSQRSHEMRLAQDAERNAARDAALREQRDLELETERARLTQQEVYDSHRRDNEMLHTRNLRQAAIDAADRENRQQIEYRRNLRLEDQAAHDARVAAEERAANIRRKDRRDEDDHDAARNRREMNVIEARRGGMRDQERLLTKQAEAFRLMERAQGQGYIGGAPAQRQLAGGWVEEMN